MNKMMKLTFQTKIQTKNLKQIMKSMKMIPSLQIFQIKKGKDLAKHQSKRQNQSELKFQKKMEKNCYMDVIKNKQRKYLTMNYY